MMSIAIFSLNGYAQTLEERLFAAAAKGDSVAIKNALAQGAAVDARNSERATPLIAAAAYGHVEAVRTLLDSKADANLQEYAGRTALMFAALRGYDRVVKLLLEIPANLDIGDRNGNTALIVASQGGHAATVELLLSKGAAVNVKEHKGLTPLLVAASQGHSAIVELLLQHGANVNATNNDGLSALHFAVRGNHGDAVRVLLAHGADRNLRVQGARPLELAKSLGYSEIAQMLEKDTGTATPVDPRSVRLASLELVKATLADDLEAVRVALDKGADVNFRIEQDVSSAAAGVTPLIIAAARNKRDVLKLLLSRKANPNIVSSGLTALMFAAKNGDREGVRALLAAGANVNAESKTGETALSIAIKEKQESVAALLRAAGAKEVAGTAEQTVVLKHEGCVRSAAASPARDFAVTAGCDGSVTLWRLPKGKLIKTIKFGATGLNGGALSSDAKVMAVATLKDISLLALPGGELLKTVAGDQHIEALSLSPDGRTVVGGAIGLVAAWDVSRGSETWNIKKDAGEVVRSVALSPDGKITATGQWRLDGAQSSLSFGTDGMSGTIVLDSDVTLYDSQTGKLLRTLKGHAQWSSSFAKRGTAWVSVAFSPDGKQLASGAMDKLIVIHDVETGKEVRKLVGHSDTITSIAYSSDGKLLVGGSADASVIVWSAETGELLHVLKGHTGAVTSVCFLDARTVLSASMDKTAAIWTIK